jgi:transcriptional regulator with XRE-family HTH domain
MNPILTLRRLLKVSQTELGTAIGVSQSMVSQYEKGASTPSPETVIKLIQFSRSRGIEVSFESIYAPDASNGPVDRFSASDDTQPPAGTSSRKFKSARKK